MDLLSISSTSAGASLPDRVVTPSAPARAAPAADIGGAQGSTITPGITSTANKRPSPEEVSRAVQDINKTIQAASQNLEFTVDRDLQEVVVKVVDQQTKEVLRQIPSEEAIEISKSLDKLQGLLIKQTA